MVPFQTTAAAESLAGLTFPKRKKGRHSGRPFLLRRHLPCLLQAVAQNTRRYEDQQLILVVDVLGATEEDAQTGDVT